MRKYLLFVVSVVLFGFAARADVAPYTPESRAEFDSYLLIQDARSILELRAKADTAAKKKEVARLEALLAKQVGDLKKSHRELVLKHLRATEIQYERDVKEGHDNPNSTKDRLLAVREVLKLFEQEQAAKKQGEAIPWITVMTGLFLTVAIAGVVLFFAGKPRTTRGHEIKRQAPTSA